MSLQLTVWWLKPQDKDNTNIAAFIPGLPHLFNPSHLNIALHRVTSGTVIQSGDIITMNTHDYITHPLPDTWILEMQLLLNRVTALSGAADHDPDDNIHSDSNDDDHRHLPHV